MRPIVRAVVIALVVSLGVIAVAETSWAAVAGGSRLIFYYSQRSLVNPAASAPSAATIVGITNQSTTDPVDIRVNIFNGATCAGFGPLSFTLSPRRTLRLNIADHVSAAGFPEGWVDVRATSAGGSPIRWDQLSGKGTLLDFGGASTAVAIYEAAALFSDNRSVSQGTLIADNGDGDTFGAVQGTADFWAPGGPFGTSHRLVVIPVSLVPGTAPLASSHTLTWRKTDETQTRSAAVASSCMIASSLADLHPSFAATYPNTVAITDGGNLEITSDFTNKGFVAALFETATSPSLLAVHSIQQFIGLTFESHE